MDSRLDLRSTEYAESDQPARCDLVEVDHVEHVELSQSARCDLAAAEGTKHLITPDQKIGRAHV